MTRHRLVAWVFAALLAALLVAPWLLPPPIWAALLGPGFNWPKGVVLLAFAGMALAYGYWMVQFVHWMRTLSSNARQHPRPLGGGVPAASAAPRGGVQGGGRSPGGDAAGRVGRGATARARVDESGV